MCKANKMIMCPEQREEGRGYLQRLWPRPNHVGDFVVETRAGARGAPPCCGHQEISPMLRTQE